MDDRLETWSYMTQPYIFDNLHCVANVCVSPEGVYGWLYLETDNSYSNKNERQVCSRN